MKAKIEEIVEKKKMSMMKQAKLGGTVKKTLNKNKRRIEGADPE